MTAVFDASAILALVNREAGATRVAELLASSDHPAMSAVNALEVMSRLIDGGLTTGDARVAIDGLALDIVPLAYADAVGAARLRHATRHLGLSIGDRACLALAELRGVPAITADRSWERLALTIPVVVIR